jgi:hypothetical protein
MPQAEAVRKIASEMQACDKAGENPIRLAGIYQARAAELGLTNDFINCGF